jgi:hypothetical protein
MTMTLTERPIPEHLDPGFRDKLASVGSANGISAEAVYAYWHQYSTDCRNFDQSAIWSEFLSWYREQLPVVPEGMHRLNG